MTFDRVQREAVRYGMTLSEFYDSTPRDLAIYLAGKREALEFEIEQGWDYVRHVMYAALSPYTPKGSSLKPEGLITLQRDKERKHGPTSEWMKQRLKEWEAQMDAEMAGIKIKKPR